MMERQLVIGGFYRHFKDKLYQVRGTAIHSETKEKMVIYQGLYGEYEMYVRPYDMFLSEVDHVKYPEAAQKYRFELIDIKTGRSLEDDYKDEYVSASYNDRGYESADVQKTTAKEETIQPKEETVEPKEETIRVKETETEEEAVQDSKLIRFLDAYDYKEKLDILTSMRGELNDGLIDIMAESIEVAVPEGDITDRYNSLRKCLLAHTKYEGLRLRQ